MRRLLITMLALCACGLPAASNDQDAGPLDSGHDDRDDAGALDASVPDASVPDAGLPDAGLPDAGLPDAGMTDAGASTDAGMPDAGFTSAHVGWARYTIALGAHAATVVLNGATSPLAGLSFATGRTYEFIFTPTAEYVLTNPVQPDDQLDWNKLPGLSDCGQVDLAQDGFMFAWRWRLDLTPHVLELAHYANNAGTHLYPAQGIVTLDADDLAAEEPLRYELSIGGAGNSKYLFHLSGTIRGRAIDVTAEHPRRCASTSPGGYKWASGLYFGGTSTAPQPIIGYVHEPP